MEVGVELEVMPRVKASGRTGVPRALDQSIGSEMFMLEAPALVGEQTRAGHFRARSGRLG